MLERYVYSKQPRHLACHTFATCLNAVTCIKEMAGWNIIKVHL